MLARHFTLTESVRLVNLSAAISRDVDAELGDLLARLAGGDDSVLPAFHDRLNILNRPELADRLRRLIGAD